MKFQFDSLADFLTMDGHGGYVWACYAVTFTALFLLAWVPKSRHKAILQQLKNQQKRAAARAAKTEQTESSQQEVSR